MLYYKYFYAGWVRQNPDLIKYCYCGGSRVNVQWRQQTSSCAPDPTLPPGHSSLPPSHFLLLPDIFHTPTPCQQTNLLPHKISQSKLNVALFLQNGFETFDQNARLCWCMPIRRIP